MLAITATAPAKPPESDHKGHPNGKLSTATPAAAFRDPGILMSTERDNGCWQVTHQSGTAHQQNSMLAVDSHTTWPHMCHTEKPVSLEMACFLASNES